MIRVVSMAADLPCGQALGGELGLAKPWLFGLRSAFLLAHVRPGQSVLDVGCGEAWFTEALLEAGVRAIGVDVAREPLERARARRPDLDVGLVEQGGELPFVDACFEVVWAGEEIEHVPDTAAWLSEVRRVLRPGGRLLISTPAHSPLGVMWLALRPSAFDAHFDPRSDHVRFYTKRTLAALLEDFRFEEINIRPAGGRLGARATLLTQAVRARF
jgi:2-polyprenyl-3-methyl-5-hydroxy-6-metoxy-1,4-benzoquinol methylase